MRSDRAGGYGYITLPTGKSGGRKEYVHRLSWKVHKGLSPPGKQVLHTCDNTVCWNPDHLFAGSNSENRVDSVAKGRHAHGSTHQWAKLTDNDVRAIRADRATGLTLKEIAAKHNVPFKTVDKIVYRVSWKHLP